MTTEIRPLKRNAINCTICQAPADQYTNYFQCQKDKNHLGDLDTGTFTDRTVPVKATPTTTRVEKPDSGRDQFRTVSDLDDAMTATNAAEDDYYPLVTFRGETYPIKQVTWDHTKKQMILEAQRLD